MPLNPSIKKVMVIGSGPIIIGQAAEFDYAGTQACKALKEQGLEVVLVNSNPATLMTDVTMADAIYIEPLIPETIKRIIEKEKPDSLLSTLGGQTGLTLSMQLAKEGFLAKHGVQLLGAKPDTIDKAEDRQLFKDTMESIGEPCIPSKVVTDIDSALDFAETIGYPIRYLFCASSRNSLPLLSSTKMSVTCKPSPGPRPRRIQSTMLPSLRLTILINVESNDFSAISRESYTSNLLTFMMSYILPLLSSEEYTVHEVSV